MDGLLPRANDSVFAIGVWAGGLGGIVGGLDGTGMLSLPDSERAWESERHSRSVREGLGARR